MKTPGLLIIIGLFLSACQEGELPGNMPGEEEMFDTRCSVAYVSGNLTGEVNSTFEASGDQDDGFVSYSTPTGIYVIGQQDGIKLSLGINWYNGPGDYEISASNYIEVVLNENTEAMASFASQTGTINIQEFRSPQGQVCLRGVFSFEAAAMKQTLDQTVSMINGEFEMTLP